jgi:hypothetical protein
MMLLKQCIQIELIRREFRFNINFHFYVLQLQAMQKLSFIKEFLFFTKY